MGKTQRDPTEEVWHGGDLCMSPRRNATHARAMHFSSESASPGGPNCFASSPNRLIPAFSSVGSRKSRGPALFGRVPRLAACSMSGEVIVFLEPVDDDAVKVMACASSQLVQQSLPRPCPFAVSPRIIALRPSPRAADSEGEGCGGSRDLGRPPDAAPPPRPRTADRRRVARLRARVLWRLEG